MTVNAALRLPQAGFQIRPRSKGIAAGGARQTQASCFSPIRDPDCLRIGPNEKGSLSSLNRPVPLSELAEGETSGCFS